MHPMILDIGYRTRSLYQTLSLNHLLTKKYAEMITDSCPSSTPKLKDNKDEINCSFGIPISFRALANPRP